ETKRHQALPSAVVDDAHSHQMLIEVTRNRVIRTRIGNMVHCDGLEPIRRRCMCRRFSGGVRDGGSLDGFNELTPAQLLVLELLDEFRDEFVHRGTSPSVR